MKSVVLASGKGGTGKTTLTALFAHLAARHLRVVVADTDVEASNLPMALGVEETSRKMFSGGAKAEIVESRCTACGRCAEVCRFDAVTPGVPYRVDLLACEGCGRCAHACPSGAVLMAPRAVGCACLGESAVGPVAFGQLGPGEDLSGRLVAEVRRLAADAAERSEAELLLIDGPPGIGCPLNAAVSGVDVLVAVAEPTVSGAHDLERLAVLAEHLRLPVRVVLNKADLSEGGALRIRTLCAARNLPLVAEIPFDAAFAGTLGALAEGREQVSGKEAATAVAGAWRAVERELELDETVPHDAVGELAPG